MGSINPRLIARNEKRSRDSLLRGIKHELRTPLNAILGFADLLLNELDGPLLPDERENVQMVRESGELLLSLINDVLDLSTALVQPAPAYPEAGDIVLLLEQLRLELEQRRGLRPVHVRVSSAQECLEVSLDQQQIARALRCLADVAWARTSAGEITLGAGLAAESGVSQVSQVSPVSPVSQVGKPVLELWIGADGFRVTTAADGGKAALEALLTAAAQTPLHTRDRAERGARLKLQMASRLFARRGAELRVALRREQPVLCVRVPLTAAEPLLPPSRQVHEADVALALMYIAAMSHELRTPLNAIMGFSDLLSRSGRPAWSAAQQRSVAIVHERACDLAALVDDMIDWAKLEAGELSVRPGPLGVSALLERVQEAATERSGGRGLQLMLHLPPEADVHIHADESRCVQALLGLLDHAIRSHPGPSVQIRVQRTAAELRIVVEDHGLHIREEDQPGVFDAFRPSYAPTGQRIAGLQLGPAVARSLMRAHGGDVWFESRPGRGTTFTAVLPLPIPTDLA